MADDNDKNGPTEVNGAPINGAAVAPAKDDGPLPWNGKVDLRKPIIANGDTVSEIVFREPTAGDIEVVGNPVTIGLYENSPKMHFETQTMSMMMARLAGVPPSTIRQMHPKDWENAAWKLANFFMPDMFM